MARAFSSDQGVAGARGVRDRGGVGAGAGGGHSSRQGSTPRANAMRSMLAKEIFQRERSTAET